VAGRERPRVLKRALAARSVIALLSPSQHWLLWSGPLIALALILLVLAAALSNWFLNDFEMARAQAWHTETVLRRPQAVADEVLLLVQADRASAVRLTATLDRSLPPALGDTCAIERVLLNLVTNARQAIDGPGEIRIVTRPAAGAEWIEVSVSDTGAGIAPDVLPRVFDPFFTTKNDGTGLGLSIVQRTVQDHGGTIDVRSARGEGTEFILRFPALPRPA